MKFRTEYHPAQLREQKLSVAGRVLMLGSCFTDNIASRMRRGMWDVAANPGGTLFNPASVARQLRLALGTAPLQLDRERCLSWDFPTAFVGEEQCREAVSVTGEYLSDAQALIVTFGTSIVYELRSEPGRIVANCHKQPADLFRERRLTVQEIVDDWTALAGELRAVNPRLRIIFTVSPVRHLKSGFEGNIRSKAVLHLAVEQLVQRIEGSSYFPAYEIVMDDLRDYRFYADDLVHPSRQGVDYVWEEFSRQYLTESDRALLRQGEQLRSRLDHRFFDAESAEAQRFRAETERLLAEHLAAHPGLRP